MDRIEFQTEDGVRLEGELRRPDGPPRGSAVICHADPKRGGSKDHPLLWAIRSALASRGFVVLAFNFRGVMGSGGTHRGGTAEVADVRAAVGRVRAEADGPTVVAGWSFGAAVALREALEDDRVAGLALVGLPLVPSPVAPDLPPLPDRASLRSLERPVLLLAGEADQFCPGPELRRLARALPWARVEILPGTDHFFWKREREASDLVGEFAARLIEGAGQEGRSGG
jgi:alpha/beta superfamily hydrolase